jgi:hypothetical protein
VDKLPNPTTPKIAPKAIKSDETAQKRDPCARPKAKAKGVRYRAQLFS